MHPVGCVIYNAPFVLWKWSDAWVTAQAALSTGTPSHLASYPPYVFKQHHFDTYDQCASGGALFIKVFTPFGVAPIVLHGAAVGCIFLCDLIGKNTPDHKSCKNLGDELFAVHSCVAAHLSSVIR